MPRGIKKPINYSEEINHINSQIERHQTIIEQLIEKREYMIQQKQQEDIQLLMSFLQQNEMSVEDLINSFQKTA